MKKYDSFSSLNLYCSSIGKYVPLSKEKICELQARIKNDDIDARNELITSNLRLVLLIVSKFTYQNVSIEDLIQVGNIGLIKAVDNYDFDNQFAFSTYAYKIIKNEILNLIYENRSLLNIGYNAHLEISKINKAKEELYNEFYREPTIKEIADKLNMEKSKVAELIISSQSVLPLSMKTNDSNDSSTLEDTIPDDKQYIEELVNNLTLKKCINELLDSLSIGQKEIVEKYFGLNGKRKMTLYQIGQYFDISKERVRQIIMQSLDNMRKSEVLDKYVMLSDNPTKIVQLLKIYREKYKKTNSSTDAKMDESVLYDYNESIKKEDNKIIDDPLKIGSIDEEQKYRSSYLYQVLESKKRHRERRNRYK